MNDSFPPVIDGVANAVMNYAKCYQENFGNAVVAVPYDPAARDDVFSFPVVRYRSINTTRLFRYRAGYPFSVRALTRLKSEKIDLIHSHCPFISTFLARTLRESTGIPIVFTYHTKFDIDIKKTIPARPLQEQALKLVVDNIQACDEVWVVSQGAGKNLRSIGYQGDYTLMKNGVDISKGRVSEERLLEISSGYDLPPDVSVYLFVGRMMWYKGLRLVFDGLKLLQEQGLGFRMVLIGDGADCEAMKDYTDKIGIQESCIFLGAVSDRDILRCWYCRADLFLFPSIYDTNGLVVREAAACGLASVLIKGSCAAEDVTDGMNGFLCDENAESLACVLGSLWGKTEAIWRAGQAAMEQLYLSWDDSVARAAKRYDRILERNEASDFKHTRNSTDKLFQTTAHVMDYVGKVRTFQKLTAAELRVIYEWEKTHL